LNPSISQTNIQSKLQHKNINNWPNSLLTYKPNHPIVLPLKSGFCPPDGPGLFTGKVYGPFEDVKLGCKGLATNYGRKPQKVF
jgi:hypothetical protein